MLNVLTSRESYCDMSYIDCEINPSSMQIYKLHATSVQKSGLEGSENTLTDAKGTAGLIST